MRQIIILFIMTLSVFVNIVKADSLPEYTMKAAYLYNFALLTDWPSNQQSDTFNICFYREDFGEASDALKNKILRNQKIRIMTISSPEEAKECHMIFIREAEEQKSEKLIQKLSGSSVLIVSETSKVSDAHIRILKENRKLAFDVSLKPIKESDLSVSSRLLKLARKVEP